MRLQLVTLQRFECLKYLATKQTIEGSRLTSVTRLVFTVVHRIAEPFATSCTGVAAHRITVHKSVLHQSQLVTRVELTSLAEEAFASRKCICTLARVVVGALHGLELWVRLDVFLTRLHAREALEREGRPQAPQDGLRPR